MHRPLELGVGPRAGNSEGGRRLNPSGLMEALGCSGLSGVTVLDFSGCWRWFVPRFTLN